MDVAPLFVSAGRYHGARGASPTVVVDAVDERMGELPPHEIAAGNESCGELALYADVHVECIRSRVRRVVEVLAFLRDIDRAHGEIPAGGIDRPEEIGTYARKKRQEIGAGEDGWLREIERPAVVKDVL